MRIFVEVKTESRINLVEKIDDDHYLVYLKEKREKGKANVALLKILKQFFKKNVVIMSGKTSKHKVVVVIDE